MREAYTEEYYDPTVGSMAGSIFSFGIAAACGANMSTRTIPEEVWYESKEKDFEFTFGCESVLGVRFGSVTGNGSLKNESTSNNNKTVTLTLESDGPEKP